MKRVISGVLAFLMCFYTACSPTSSNNSAGSYANSTSDSDLVAFEAVPAAFERMFPQISSIPNWKKYFRQDTFVKLARNLETGSFEQVMERFGVTKQGLARLKAERPTEIAKLARAVPMAQAAIRKYGHTLQPNVLAAEIAKPEVQRWLSSLTIESQGTGADALALSSVNSSKGAEVAAIWMLPIFLMAIVVGTFFTLAGALCFGGTLWAASDAFFKDEDFLQASGIAIGGTLVCLGSFGSIGLLLIGWGGNSIEGMSN